MKLIIDAPDEIVKKGFEGPLTDEERQVLIRAIGNGIAYKERQGEWVPTTSGGMCPFCGQVSPNGFTQCRYCGALMKGGAE